MTLPLREERMAVFDSQVFVTFLRANVSPLPFGAGKCALHVRLALKQAGLEPLLQPISAKDWGKTLLALGFGIGPVDAMDAVSGDIAVIQATSDSIHGHIQGFDGRQWISDFVQKRGFWPGPKFRDERPGFVIYRWAG